MRLPIICALVWLAAQAESLAVPIHDVGGLRIIEHPDPEKRQSLQNIVRCPQAEPQVQLLTMRR
jgi:hypothetical protein